MNPGPDAKIRCQDSLGDRVGAPEISSKPPKTAQLPAILRLSLRFLVLMLSAFTARPIVELKQRDKSKIEAVLAYGEVGLTRTSICADRLY